MLGHLLAGWWLGPRAGLTGLTGLCSAQDAPDRRLAFGLWPPSSVPGHTGSLGSGGAARRTLAPRKQSPGFQKGQDAKARTLLVGGWVGESRGHNTPSTILKFNTVRLTSHPCRNVLVNKQSSYGVPWGAAPLVSR